MVTLAQRIESLRNERGLSRPALSAALAFPKGAIEKFETGRQTPSREQQEKMADYFGVSLFYLRGESNDRTRQDTWMDGGFEDDEPAPAPRRTAAKQPAHAPEDTGSAPVFGALLSSPAFQDMVRSTLLDILRSPEGEALVRRVVRKELDRR
jgi:transcriptional regulator with XRE-family HTH domain